MDLLNIWLWIIIIQTLLVVITPLIDMIFNEQVVEFINNGISNIDYMIWSTQTNILLIIITLWIFVKVLKWILRIVHWND